MAFFDTDENDYPIWVCDKCAKEAGGKMPINHIATYHIGLCDVCKEEKSVTEPRDWKYPKFK